MFNSKVVHHQRACYLEPHNLLLVLHSQNSKILVCFCVIYRSRRERQMTAPNPQPIPQPALVNTFLYYCFSQICSDSHNVRSLLSEADVISHYNYYYHDNYTLRCELKILIDYLIVSEGEVLFFNYQLISLKNNKSIESNLFWMSIE